MPFGFRAKSRELLAIAGLWDEWHPPEGPALRTFTLLTTEANADIASFHDRMPAILLPDAEERWLNTDEEDPARLAPLLAPLKSGALESFPVSFRLNRPENDDPSVQEAPLGEPPRQSKPVESERSVQRNLWENGDDDDAA
jgi:putative SOS response-associated peptidase YedK